MGRARAHSGYTQCPCCGEDTMSSDMSKPELCELCEEAGCDSDGTDCERTDSFDVDDVED